MASPHGGKVTSCKPNRTRIITVNLGSMKKKKGKNSAYLNISFPYCNL